MPKDISKASNEVQLDEVVLDVIDRMSVYAGEERDWLKIKAAALKRLPIHQRENFSLRDPVTKRHTINAYEAIFIERWFEKTGVRLTLHERKAA